MKAFGIEESFMRENSSYNTLNEIYQQPITWSETCEQIKNSGNEIQYFINQVVTQEDFDIILTGAGTSEFVGNALFSELNKKYNHRVKSYATTDIVTNPENYLSNSKPTLLISFGRSGNSPESVGAVQIAETVCKNLYHLIITCNSNGELSKMAETKNNCYVINLNDKTHDKAFAMTSSFTNMYLAAYLCFNLDNINEIMEKVSKVIKAGQKYLDEGYVIAKQIVDDFDFNRIVYLGSNSLKGIAQESSLKMLELSSGKVVTAFDSPLGFRHGPKSIINDEALTIFYISDNEYTRKYEIDLLSEMSSQRKNNKIVTVMSRSDSNISSLSDYTVIMNIENLNSNVLLGLNYILFAQTLATFKSIKMGITPDNPCITGEVNRVVKGVKIYEY